MSLDDLLALVERPRKIGRQWVANCPAHPDRHPSLAIAETDDRLLVHCRAGCTTEAVCAALGIRLSDLFSATKSKSVARPRSAPKARPEDEELKLWTCALGLRLRAVAVLEAARGCDTTGWTDEDFDQGMGYVTQAHDELGQAEVCDALAFSIRCELLAKKDAAA